jgi:hypothetical protein
MVETGKMEDNYFELITNVITGNASAGQAEKLGTLLQKNERVKHLYEELKRIYGEKKQTVMPVFNEDTAFESLKKRLGR